LAALQTKGANQIIRIFCFHAAEGISSLARPRGIGSMLAALYDGVTRIPVQVPDDLAVVAHNASVLLPAAEQAAGPNTPELL
jgi:hypothetical protein